MLVDTGSAVTLVHKRLLDRIGVVKVLEGVEDRVVSANGQPLGILGRCDLRIGIGGVDELHPVLVANDVTQDCLIGVDFLARHKVIIDFAAGLVCANGQNVGLHCGGAASVSVCGRVCVAETVTVPGRHEMVLPAMCEKAGLSGGGISSIVEPSPEFAKRHSLVMARVLVQPRGDLVPVRLINPSADPVVLYKNTTLGTITALDECALPKQEKPPAVMTVRKSPASLPKKTKEELATMFNLETSKMSQQETKKLLGLLDEFQDVYSRGPDDLGRTSKVYHQIPTGSAKPIKQGPRRLPYHQREEVEKNLDAMIKNGVVTPSTSPWSSPIVLVKKKDGTTRFCVDYRKLNDVTRKDAYPLPRIDATLDALGGAGYFSTMDLASGYWQVEVDPSDREKTAFATFKGLFEFRVMPFGLTGAPNTFQRLMDSALSGLQFETCLVYLDDIVVFSKTFDEHIARLRQVLSRLRESGLKVKPSKCHLLRERVPFLGHIISREGVATDPAKVQAVTSWPAPTTKSDVRSFLGLASYYRRFIKNFAEIAAPLYKLSTSGKESAFAWSLECERAFRGLKGRLVEAPVLAYPRFDLEFVLDTDASDFGIGAVLSQVQDGQEKVIAYASRALSKAERNYSVTKKEMLALVFYAGYFRHYLYGRRFTARTDHGALNWLKNFKEPSGQVARWLEQLAEFDFTVQHRAGQKHGNADAMSRKPVAVDPQVNAVEGQGWSLRWTSAELREKQLADPHLAQVIAWKEAVDEPPTKDELQGSSPTVRDLCAQWDRLELRDGVLYRNWVSEDGAESRMLLVVPRELVDEILHLMHDAPFAGHLGVTKTVAKIRERFHWTGLNQDVEDWCRRCELCIKLKPPQKAGRAPLVSVQPGYPLERVALDILGPLPESDLGNRYIMVVGDYFTKWTEAYPIPNQEAITIARKLVDEFVCRFGAPETLHTDQGRNFESNLFKELCRLLGIVKTRTSAYHPEGDGMIERFNRTVVSMLSNYVSDNQRDWDRHLPQVMMAYRSSKHESTKYPPFFMMFGRDVKLPIDVMFGRAPGQPQETVEYTRGLRDSLEAAHNKARTHLQAAQKRQKDYYDRRVAGTSFRVGDRVLLSTTAVKRGLSPKLHHQWQGPYVVLDKVSEVNYRVQLATGQGRKQVVHFNRLRPFNHARPMLHLDEADDDANNNNEPVQRPAARPHFGAAEYQLDETDLLYQDDVASIDEPADADLLYPDNAAWTDEPVEVDQVLPANTRPRRQIRPPAWMRDFTEWMTQTDLNLLIFLVEVNLICYRHEDMSSSKEGVM